MKNRFQLFAIILALCTIGVYSCEDSEDDLSPDDQNQFTVNDEIVTQEFVYGNRSYQVSHYSEGDTLKRFIENEELIALNNALGGNQKFMNIKVNEQNVATYHLYDTSDELFAATPDLKPLMEARVEGTVNGRTAQTGFVRVVGWDNKNYGGAVRFATDCDGLQCGFNVIGDECSYNVSPGYNPVCKDNDISSLLILNVATSTAYVAFYDRTFLDSMGNFFIVTLSPNATWSESDLKVLTNKWYTRANWHFILAE